MARSKKTQPQEAQPSAQVNLYTHAALAENTYRSYRADLKHFKAAGGSIPCTAVQLAEYLAVESRMNGSLAAGMRSLWAGRSSEACWQT